MSVAGTIRSAIKRGGKSQAAIARESGVSQGQLSRFVHGERMLTVENLERVAEALGLEIMVRRTKKRGG